MGVCAHVVIYYYINIYTCRSWSMFMFDGFFFSHEGCSISFTNEAILQVRLNQTRWVPLFSAPGMKSVAIRLGHRLSLSLSIECIKCVLYKPMMYNENDV